MYLKRLVFLSPSKLSCGCLLEKYLFYRNEIWLDANKSRISYHIKKFSSNTEQQNEDSIEIWPQSKFDTSNIRRDLVKFGEIINFELSIRNTMWIILLFFWHAK